MRNTLRFAMVSALCGMLLAMGNTVLAAQDASAGGRPGGAAAGSQLAAQPQPPAPGGRRARNDIDQYAPARVLERRLATTLAELRQDLEATEEQWKVIRPP
jgi:hypothetical protein